MSWRSIHQILKDASDSATRLVVDHPEALPEPNQALKEHYGLLGATAAEIAHANNALKDDVDAACHHFAEHLRWPAISKDVAWAIVPRVVAGEQFARFVARPSLPTTMSLPDFERANLRPFMLSWVLVDYWHRAGIWRWYASMHALFSGENYDDETN